MKTNKLDLILVVATFISLVVIAGILLIYLILLSVIFYSLGNITLLLASLAALSLPITMFILAIVIDAKFDINRNKIIDRESKEEIIKRMDKLENSLYKYWQP